MEYSLKNWMKNVDGNRDLFSLNILGTHDCVTQYIQYSKWSRCQNVNIYEQLSLGARALDIRVMPNKDKTRLVMIHGIAKAFNTKSHFSKQMDLEDVLKHTYRFLDENKSEAIIYQVKNENFKEMEKSMDLLFNKYIKEAPKYWFTENRIPTLDEARGKIILIRRCKIDTSNKHYTDLNSGINFSNWIEQNATVPEILTLDNKNLEGEVLNKFIIQDRYRYKPSPRWNDVIKPFLDSRKEFDGNYIVNYLSTAGGIKGPLYNANYINPRFLDFNLKKGYYYGTTYIDFITDILAKKYIDTNF